MISVESTPERYSFMKPYPKFGLQCTFPNGATNYSVALRLTVVAGGVTHETDWFFLQPDDDGYLEYEARILGSYIVAPDLPSEDELVELMPNYTVSYKLIYAELYGSTPTLHNEASTAVFYCFPGSCVSKYASLNKPDWRIDLSYRLSDEMSAGFYLLGSDVDGDSYVCGGQRSFVYLFWNGGSLSFRNMSLRANGNVVETFRVQSGRVYRIAVDGGSLGVSGPEYEWSIAMLPSGVGPDLYEIKHRNTVVPRPWRGVDVLVVDKYGLQRGMVLRDCRMELVTEGESVKYGDSHGISYKDCYQLYTCKTGKLRRREIMELAESMAGQFNYCKVDGEWRRILFQPGSFVVDEEGLCEMEVQFRFVDEEFLLHF